MSIKDSFVNGYTYKYDFHLARPSGKKNRIPYVKVDISTIYSKGFQPVIGKVDTGSGKTLLSFDTGKTLGINNPKINPFTEDYSELLDNKRLPCYVHQVFVLVKDFNGVSYQFPIWACFVENISRNLFGRDWLKHFCCLTCDLYGIHLLHD